MADTHRISIRYELDLSASPASPDVIGVLSTENNDIALGFYDFDRRQLLSNRLINGTTQNQTEALMAVSGWREVCDINSTFISEEGISRLVKLLSEDISGDPDALEYYEGLVRKYIVYLADWIGRDSGRIYYSDNLTAMPSVAFISELLSCGDLSADEEVTMLIFRNQNASTGEYVYHVLVVCEKDLTGRYLPGVGKGVYLIEPKHANNPVVLTGHTFLPPAVLGCNIFCAAESNNRLGTLITALADTVWSMHAPNKAFPNLMVPSCYAVGDVAVNETNCPVVIGCTVTEVISLLGIDARIVVGSGNMLEQVLNVTQFQLPTYKHQEFKNYQEILNKTPAEKAEDDIVYMLTDTENERQK